MTKLAQCGDCGEIDTMGFGECLTQITQLGARAKLLMQVGALQDELIKLGFEQSGFGWCNLTIGCNHYYVTFNNDAVSIRKHREDNAGFTIKFTNQNDNVHSENYLQRALNKVKELIGVDNE